MLDREGTAERATGMSPEVGTVRGPGPELVPIAPAPRVPPSDLRSEWRGTLPEAIRESAAKNGISGLASADWASQAALRVMSPQDLAASIERTHARVAANEPQPSVYTVGADGTIYNTVTNRAEYVPVREASAPAAVPDLRNEQPRLQEERREAEITRRIEEARANHQLPDVDGLTYSQRGELYGRMYLEGTDAAGRQAFEAGGRVIYSMRVPTNVRANEGHGIYDDRVVILQRTSDGTARLLYEGRITTEPSGRYEDQGPFGVTGKEEGRDVDGDGRLDLGRLRAGTSYEFEWAHADEERFGGPVFPGHEWNVMRPVESVVTDRDPNHDGRLDAVDGTQYRHPERLSAGKSIYFHQGGELLRAGSNLPANGTYSAGCQTMPRSEFRGDFARAVDPASGQTTFRYTIQEM